MLDLDSASEHNQPMTRTLKRVAPLQFGKMMGVLYALLGLIFLPFFGLFALIGAFAQSGSKEAGAAGAIAAGGMLLMGILMPVIYGIFGFVFGALSALLYNVIARWIGGIEVEVE